MALASASGLASFDQSAGEFLDLSNELAEIIRRDNTAFLSRLGISKIFGPGASIQEIVAYIKSAVRK